MAVLRQRIGSYCRGPWRIIRRSPQRVMDYFKRFLCGLTSIFLAECVPGPWSVFKGVSREKATGLAALAGGLAESAFSPLFWIVAILFFALLYTASRHRNNFLRVFLFWIPTLTVSVFCIAFVTLYAYLFIRFRQP